MPDAGADKDGTEPLGLCQEVDRVDPEPPQDHVYDATRRGKGRDHDTGNNHRRDKVRQVNDCLCRSFIGCVDHLVEHQGKDDRRRESEQQVVETDCDRVLDGANELIIAKKGLEMLETYPGTALNPSEYRVVLERNLQTVHWFVEKNDEPDNRWQQHGIDLPFAPEMIPGTDPGSIGFLSLGAVSQGFACLNDNFLHGNAADI